MESRHAADKPKENRCASLLLLLVSTFSFSIQVLLVRWLTQQGIGTFQLLLVRGSCQGLGCCLWLRGQPLETWLGTTLLEYQALFVRAVLGYCALCFCFMSISLMPFADALILGQTAPIFWQILGWGLLEEAWHVSDTVSASTALFGVGFLCKPPGPLSSFTIFRGFRHFVGFLCGLLGCVSTGSAAETLVIHWVGRVKVSWPSVVLAQALGQLIISPFAVAVSGEPLRLFTQQQLGVALLLSLLGFASQIAQIQGMQQARIASASLIHYMFCPLLGLLYQHLVFEELTWTSFAGYGFVSTAIVMSHLAKERRAQLAQPAKYSEVARSEAHSEGEGSPAQSVECMGFNPQDASVYGKRSFFDEGPGQDREDEMIEGLRSDGFSRRQAELALAEVQWSSREEALDVLLDVKFQLSSNGKALEPGADSARPAGPLRPVQEANEASEANEAEG